MGWIFTRKEHRKNRFAFYIGYRVNGKARIKKVASGNTETDKRALDYAKTKLKEKEIRILKGIALDADRLRFSDAAREFLEHAKTDGHKSVDKYEDSVNALLRYFRDKYLDQIHPEDVEKFKAERLKEQVGKAMLNGEPKKTISQPTVNRNLGCLRAIFNEMIDLEKFEGRNPVRKKKFFKERARDRILKLEEIYKLFQNADDALRVFMLILLNTGARVSEIYNRKWDDVDFTQRLIILRETKNDETRIVPMNKVVETVFLKLSQERTSEFVFPIREKGERYTYDYFRDKFLRVCKDCGIVNLRLHDFRRTAISYMQMRSKDPTGVSRIAGHKTQSMTNRYTFYNEEALRNVVDCLDFTPETDKAQLLYDTAIRSEEEVLTH